MARKLHYTEDDFIKATSRAEARINQMRREITIMDYAMELLVRHDVTRLNDVPEPDLSEWHDFAYGKWDE
jgi:hypothetical protein